MGGTPASFGYWVRRRRLALDLTRDALARRVGCSTSTLKKIERDERRPSRTMATQLAEAFGLSPGQRERFIDVGLGVVGPDKIGVNKASGPLASLPSWLAHPRRVEFYPVVGREGELARLLRHLSAALDGYGRAVFVTGEAGQGKTALLRAFAERACAEVPDLVVARGAGTAAGGYGSPYLPVRDVLTMLVADRHAPMRADELTGEQTQRLWDGAATVAELIVDSGPHLLDVLVPADAVRERLGLSIAPQADAAAPRDHVVEEFTDVLRALSEHRPVLVLLDDMQWADSASVDLLFHLARRLYDARLLVVCAFRGSEVPAAAVLRKAMLETSRDIDGAQIDLDAIGTAAERALCQALLDVEVPGLDESLCDEVYRRTRGHPLFVRELVRELKESGHLVRRPDGGWAPGPDLRWDRIPSRVAAVIEQRLNRLSADEHALVAAAAVEGEYFTVEVVARVAGVEEWKAHRLLADRLGRVHALVREASTGRSGSRTFTRYRFGHELFQWFVYEQMNQGARAHAHGRIATELEAIHAANVDPVVPELAYHYAEAGDAERAVPYLLQTGDRARLLYAYDEAVAAYERATELLRRHGDTERLARTMIRIGLTYQTAFDHTNAQRALNEAFALWPAMDASRSEGAVGSTTLRLAADESPLLDPVLYSSGVSIATSLFSGLVRYDEGTNIVPDVAERWEISSDGRRYIFHLREDVTWNDGVPVTAEDFVYAYRRALDPATNSEYAVTLLAPVAGVRDVHECREPPEHVGVRALGDHTLVIELAEPTSYFMYNLVQGALMPVPRHVVEKHRQAWCQPETFVSNGPFQLATCEPGYRTVLERNPRYHGEASGNVQRVSLRITPPHDHEQLYAADEVDVLSNSLRTNIGVIDRLRRRFPADHVRGDEGFLTVFYWLDMNRSPLDDLRLRRAMAAAVDRDALALRWYRGMSTPATGGFVPPGIPGHSPGIALPQDHDRAAQLIAGCLGGDTPRFAVVGMDFLEPLVQELVHDWGDVGLPIDVRLCRTFNDLELEWSRTGGPRIGVVGWVADYPDPDTFLRIAVEHFLPQWGSDRYALLIDKATRSSDPRQRLELYRQAEQLLSEEAVLVPLVYQPEHLMLKPWVTRFPTVRFLYRGFWKDVMIGPQPLSHE